VVFIDKAFLHHAWIQDWYGWRGYKTGTDELLVSSEDKYEKWTADVSSTTLNISLRHYLSWRVRSTHTRSYRGERVY